MAAALVRRVLTPPLLDITCRRSGIPAWSVGRWLSRPTDSANRGSSRLRVARCSRQDDVRELFRALDDLGGSDGDTAATGNGLRFGGERCQAPFAWARMCEEALSEELAWVELVDDGEGVELGGESDEGRGRRPFRSGRCLGRGYVYGRRLLPACAGHRRNAVA